MILTAARAASSEPEAGIVQLKKRRGREGPVQHCFGGALGGKKEGRFGGKIPKKSQLSLKTGGCSKGVVKPSGSNSAREHGLSTGSIAPSRTEVGRAVGYKRKRTQRNTHYPQTTFEGQEDRGGRAGKREGRARFKGKPEEHLLNQQRCRTSGR